MTLICAKFGVDLINISKVTSCKTKWPQFFGLPGIFSSSSTCSTHQKVCRWYKGLQLISLPWLIITGCDLRVEPRPKTNLLTVCWWLQLRWRLCFTPETQQDTVSYRKEIARLHSRRRWRGRPCSNFCLIGGRLITMQNLGTVSHYVRACQF